MERAFDYHKCTILYIDDEEKSLKYFIRAFGDKFEIVSAANASDGYRLLEQYRDQIALLFIDQRLPGEKGVEFLQRARRVRPNAIRILTTAYTDFDALIEAVNSAGIFKYVPKPWDIPQLETILRRACELFLIQREQELANRAKSSAHRSLAVDRHAESGNLLTPEQVADYLNVNKFTIYRLITQKKIPAFKVGNQWRFKQKMLDAWLMTKSNVQIKNLN